MIIHRTVSLVMSTSACSGDSGNSGFSDVFEFQSLKAKELQAKILRNFFDWRVSAKEQQLTKFLFLSGRRSKEDLYIL